ncbi:MAG: hypothetical protein K5669_10735 [Lachnospiraceae bacterium]|nr:hypothetical protein [Lachnospiraceae bacterium]
MENELFNPIKEYFERQGYVCDGEVEDIDLYMEKGEDHVAVELKVDLDFKALRQAALRQKYVETVYIGIFKPSNMRSAAFRDKLYLLKRLGIGLIVVSKRSKEVEIANKPLVSELSEFQKRNKKKGEALSKEFSKRKTKNNIGGVRGTKLITSYREDALLVLDALAEACSEAKDVTLGIKNTIIRKSSGIEKTSAILRYNYYGWFEMTEKSYYRVSDAGYAALEEFEDTIYKLKRGKWKQSEDI